MKKLRLRIEHLEVESFETLAGGEGGRGTVRGLASSPATACEAACQTAAFTCAPDPESGCVVEEYTPFIASCPADLCYSIDPCAASGDETCG